VTSSKFYQSGKEVFPAVLAPHCSTVIPVEVSLLGVRVAALQIALKAQQPPMKAHE
jgi:hypothetical protein